MDQLADLNNPMEVRKFASAPYIQLQDPRRPAYDEESGAFVADYEELLRKYFRAKGEYMEWFLHQNI